MDTNTMITQAFDNVKNGDFSKAKPLIKSIIGQNVNKELESREFNKVKCTVPDIPDED